MSQPSLRRLLCLLVGLSSGPAALADPVPPRYLVTPLAPGTPARINDAGEIAGTIQAPTAFGSTSHAAVFRDGAWLDLGALPDDTTSSAADIDSLGVVVGTSSRAFTLSDARYRAVKLRVGEVLAVPGLDGTDSQALGVNDSGQVCGRMGPLQPDHQKPWHAFVADAVQVLDLHPYVEAALAGTVPETTAQDLNGRGDVVGRADGPFEPRIAFLYRDGAVTMLEGADSAVSWQMHDANAINDAGQVAGTAFVTPAGSTRPQDRAALYDAVTGTFTPLAVPPDAGALVRSSAFDIDAAGRVVGEALVEVPTGGGRNFAFLYENGRMTDLNTLIPADSGWELEIAIAINGAGQIAGRGRFLGTHGHYFLLTPAVNEPPAVTIQAPPEADEGGTLTLTAVAADPEGGALLYDWDLDGDGTYERVNAGVEVVLSPAGDDGPATRACFVRVWDDGGLSAVATIAVPIRNVPPVATLTASATTVSVGTTVDLALVDPSDPSVSDTAHGFSFSWACTADAPFGAGEATHACVYGVGGPQVARGRIADKDGGVSEYSVQLTVLTAEDRIVSLIQAVEDVGLAQGIETSLVAKLRAAVAALQAGNVSAARAQLRAFVNQCRAQQGKALTPDQASRMIADAQAIDALLVA